MYADPKNANPYDSISNDIGRRFPVAGSGHNRRRGSTSGHGNGWGVAGDLNDSGPRLRVRSRNPLPSSSLFPDNLFRFPYDYAPFKSSIKTKLLKKGGMDE
jgi:hypothetical protein